MIRPEILDEIEKLHDQKLEYVYLIQCGDSTYYKIGRAIDVLKRREALQIANPYYLRIVGVLSTYNPQRLEQQMHKMFKTKRMYGEWFNLTRQEVQEFCTQPGKVDLKSVHYIGHIT